MRNPFQNTFLIAALCLATQGRAETVALWLFDEPAGIYPSTTMTGNGPNDYTIIAEQQKPMSYQFRVKAGE